MNCNDVRENLIELLTDGPADPQVKTHSASARLHGGTCSMRKTMAVLDEWEAPEPSPYFLTRLRAHVKEEREKAPAAKCLAGCAVRCWRLSLATVLAGAGLGYRLIMATPPDNGAVADIESLDKNHDLIIDTDLVNELTGDPSDDVAEP